jgi:2'-5' RNA ligase
MPVKMRQEIWESAELLRESGGAIRWVAPEAIHLTLKFLGEISANQEDSIVNALKAATERIPPFVLPVGGFGAFPNTRRATVIWVGCGHSSSLELLQRNIEEKMSEIGFPKEKRAYHPHVTLGRLRRGGASSGMSGLAGLLDRLEYAGEISVSSIELMRSKLTPSGAIYSVHTSVELRT